MKSFSTNLIAALLIGSLGLAGSAYACGGGGNGGNNNHNNQNCNNGGYNNGGGYDNNFGGQAYEPFHSTYICQPGDSFYESRAQGIRQQLPDEVHRPLQPYGHQRGPRPRTQVVPPGDQRRRSDVGLPCPRGRRDRHLALCDLALRQLALHDAGRQPRPAATTIAAPAPVAVEAERVSVPTGSTLQLDGEKLGSDAGVVRLRISGVALPVEVIEWSADSTKIRLPKVDVTEATKAELEVVRADGTLASTNAISLTSAATSVAAN